MSLVRSTTSSTSLTTPQSKQIGSQQPQTSTPSTTTLTRPQSSGLQTSSTTARTTTPQQQQQQPQQQQQQQQQQQHQSQNKQTPQQQQQRQPIPSPSPSTPGRWQHPRMSEIQTRQNRSNFDQTNLLALCKTLALFIATFFAKPGLDLVMPAKTHTPYSTPTLLLLRALLLASAALTLLPLTRTPDPCYDIPLTPSQRQLLGLPPLNRAPTLQEKEAYVTPPRYSRTPTPRSTPTPGSGTPTGTGGWRSASGSPLTLASASASGQRDSSRRVVPQQRRLSYSNSPRGSPLSISEFDSLGGTINSPSAGGGLMSKKEGQMRASVGLNSKWLYEKGRRASGSPVGAAAMGWGTGSVFS